MEKNNTPSPRLEMLYTWLKDTTSQAAPCVMRNFEIAGITGLAVRTVQQQLADLEAAGLIIRTAKPLGHTGPLTAKAKRFIYVTSEITIKPNQAPETPPQAMLHSLTLAELWEKLPPGPVHPQVLHDNSLTPLARLVYVEVSTLFGNGTGTVGYQGYAAQFDVSQQDVAQAFHQLYLGGYLWLYEPAPGQLVYGTVSGLWQQLVLTSSAGKDQQEVKRLRMILNTHAVGGAQSKAS